MTKEQFEEGTSEFLERGVIRGYALIGPREEDAYLVIDEDGDLYYNCEGGILINQGKTFHYLPYESIIALTGTR